MLKFGAAFRLAAESVGIVGDDVQPTNRPPASVVRTNSLRDADKGMRETPLRRIVRSGPPRSYAPTRSIDGSVHAGLDKGTEEDSRNGVESGSAGWLTA